MATTSLFRNLRSINALSTRFRFCGCERLRFVAMLPLLLWACAAICFAGEDDSWTATVKERRQWWSLQPVSRPKIPSVRNSDWSAHPIDRFILAKLEEHGLTPSPSADSTILARRLSFLLTGLPPSPEETQAFAEAAAQDSRRAVEQLVDRLLASPHFGERWARHWMDVVRYGDTYGYEWDIPAKGAWRYRDYLIRAFNADVPFDQIIREQIAGDLLKEPRIDATTQINESLIGPMFYLLGEYRHGDSAEFDGIHQEMLDNQIDAFGKAFQATTIACARCHDHKIDVVSQRDYYALAGVFMSSRWLTRTLDLPNKTQSIRPKIESLKRDLRPSLTALWLADTKHFADRLLEAQTNLNILAASSNNPAPPTNKASASSDKSASSAPTPVLTNVWETVLYFPTNKTPSIEDLRYPWFQLAKAAREGADVESRWRELAQEYQTNREQRLLQNAERFIVVTNFHESLPRGWSMDGLGLQQGPAARGDFALAADGSNIVEHVIEEGWFTDSHSSRLNGALRTPFLNTFTNRFIFFEASGGDFAAHRTVVDNAFLTERQQYLRTNLPTWIRVSTFPEMRERRIYVEFATKTSNGNFPPRVGLGGKCTEDQAADPRSWFGLTRVWLGNQETNPAPELVEFPALFSGDAPKDLAGVAERYAQWLAESIRAWSDNKALAHDIRLINWMLYHRLLPNRLEPSSPAPIQRFMARYRELESQIKNPETINSLAELDASVDYRFNHRGNYDALGDPVPRGYVAALTPAGQRIGLKGSGRRELAELIASPENPLTARVIVNRVWDWLFGTGLVATPNDFGRLGERPSHPELLDYLASEFQDDGCSIKRLIRRIVLTETFCQSGQVASNARAIDPENRWLHHFPSRRLEAEAVRDVILAVAGRLDAQLYGPPIDPFRLNEDPEKRLFSGPIDGQGRRALYTKVTIMEPPKFLAAFNQPNPKMSTGKRDVTNLPAQALALLNDPFVTGLAEFWAKRLVEMPHRSPSERIAYMFQRAFNRQARADELSRWLGLFNEMASQQNASAGTAMTCVPAWKAVAHALFNAKEFIYVR
ncbi:MAG: DUF1553 domain-containing protein [Verrucomicrobia bacterium]|nr:DUF1553 domain-containing protein [Verrucomicrobiota bacterium]